jgi:hypothetical protein
VDVASEVDRRLRPTIGLVRPITFDRFHENFRPCLFVNDIAASFDADYTQRSGQVS